MPYCTKCGGEVMEQMLFCYECGSELIAPKDDSEANKLPDNATDAEVSKQEATPGRGIRKGKLYKQWVKYAGLPVQKIPSIKASGDTLLRRKNNTQSPHLLYMLLGVAILICIGLVILLVKIW